MTRSVLEGVAFGLRDGLDQMLATGMPRPSQIRASGGGTASTLWRQIIADVLDAELATVSTTEGAAFGAAMLGAVGAGWHRTVEDAAAAFVKVDPVASPGPDAARYAGSTPRTGSCIRPWRRRSIGTRRRSKGTRRAGSVPPGRQIALEGSVSRRPRARRVLHTHGFSAVDDSAMAFDPACSLRST